MYHWAFILIVFFNLNNTIARPEHQQNSVHKIRENLDNKNELSMHPVPPSPQQDDRQSWLNHETETAHWHEEALNILNERLNNEINTNIAKNIILFLGDGLSVPTLYAARIYQGQLDGKSGEEGALYWESFPYTALSKTWCIDSQVPDSACTSTAYMTGVKSKYGTIGVNGNVVRGVCATQNDMKNRVDSILKLAQNQNKSVGIVTTTRVTHASPAGGYAYVAERNWESDNDVMESGNDPNECMDIASQLITQYPGKEFKVILGGGRRKFLPESVNDEENIPGERLDGKNLIEMWKNEKMNRDSKYSYVWNRTTLMDAMEDGNNYDFLLGLFHSSHLPYHLEAHSEKYPTISEMTQAAIKVLRKNDNGFILFVEGGRIDHAHHGTYATLALDETVEFAKAVKIGREMTSTDDTLVIVTGDHGHTMSVAGYSHRGVKINGPNTKFGDDNLAYTTLSYANGPGYRKPDKASGGRHNISNDNIDDLRYRFPSLVPLSTETHGGEDVTIFSSGPWSHLFTGTIQQSNIPHFIAYASCLSPISACNDNRSNK